MENQRKRLALLQFGLRDAIALTVAFALMFFAVLPRYPSAHSITKQRALNEINRDNVVEGEYYQGYEYAYLKLVEPITDGNGNAVNTVSVDDPDRELVSALGNRSRAGAMISQIDLDTKRGFRPQCSYEQAKTTPRTAA